MNCCGCTPQAGLTPGTAQYGLTPCLTLYDFKLLDNYAQMSVPVDGLYEVSVANFGTNVNQAVLGVEGSNYAVVSLRADSPVYIDYSSGTKLYQDGTVVDSGNTLGSKDYRQGVKVRLLGTATLARHRHIAKLSAALTDDAEWRDTVYTNGRTMMDMAGNQAVVPTRFGSWKKYPTDSRMVIVGDIIVAKAGTYTLHALSKTTLGVVVNNEMVRALKDNEGGTYEGFGALSVSVNLKAGLNSIVLQNSNTTGKPTEMYTSFVIERDDGMILFTPGDVAVTYERQDDCSGSDSRAPRMQCWFYDMVAPLNASNQTVKLTTPGWYQIVVAASGQTVDAALPTNTGQGLAVFEAKAGDEVVVTFGDYVYATLPDGSIVESLPGDGATKGSSRLIFISKDVDVKKTHARSLGSRPSWKNDNPPAEMKFTRVVAGFEDMGSVPGNVSMYLIGAVTLEAGQYISNTWADDVSVVFLDGRMINQSVGWPDGGKGVDYGPPWGKWLGWDASIRPFAITESGTHQVIIYNINVPAWTPGWSCFTILDGEGNVVHEVDTDYFALNTIYDCAVDEEE